MNCPQCEAHVGNDEYSYSRFRKIVGPTGVVEGAYRLIYIRCSHCGVSTATQQHDGRISAIRRIDDPRRATSITRAHIPAGKVRPVAMGAC